MGSRWSGVVSFYSDWYLKVSYIRFPFCQSWQRLAHFYYKDSQAALIVYDVQDHQTLRTAKI